MYFEHTSNISKVYQTALEHLQSELKKQIELNRLTLQKQREIHLTELRSLAEENKRLEEDVEKLKAKRFNIEQRRKEYKRRYQELLNKVLPPGGGKINGQLDDLQNPVSTPRSIEKQPKQETVIIEDKEKVVDIEILSDEESEEKDLSLFTRFKAHQKKKAEKKAQQVETFQEPAPPTERKKKKKKKKKKKVETPKPVKKRKISTPKYLINQTIEDFMKERAEDPKKKDTPVEKKKYSVYYEKSTSTTAKTTVPKQNIENAKKKKSPKRVAALSLQPKDSKEGILKNYGREAGIVDLTVDSQVVAVRNVPTFDTQQNQPYLEIVNNSKSSKPPEQLSTEQSDKNTTVKSVQTEGGVEEKSGKYNSDIPYKYVEVVRKKSEREKLPGHSCEQCEQFFEAVKGTLKDGNTKRLISECSRHRYRYSPPHTPPHFWELDKFTQEENTQSTFQSTNTSKPSLSY